MKTLIDNQMATNGAVNGSVVNQADSFLLPNHHEYLQHLKNGSSAAMRKKVLESIINEQLICVPPPPQSTTAVVEKLPCSPKQIDPRNYDHLLDLAEVIRQKADLKETPSIGIICGSGLGSLADQITDAKVLPYSEVPGFPNTNVVGHKGNLVFGRLGNGGGGGVYVMCLQGRFHPYENHMDLALCSMPVRIMHLLGVKTLIVSNAAGGVNPKFGQGDLMIIKDHLFMPGLAGHSPLVGINDPRFGDRFVSVHDAYDNAMRKLAFEVSQSEGLTVHEGIYVMSGGPQYESPAEVSFYRDVGGDALGMSTCHEVIVARQCQMRVFGFSLITNICSTDADSSVEVSHSEVLQMGLEAGNRAVRFVTSIIEKIGAGHLEIIETNTLSVEMLEEDIGLEAAAEACA